MSSGIPNSPTSQSEIVADPPSILEPAQSALRNRFSARWLVRWLVLSIVVAGVVAAYPLWQWQKTRIGWQEIEEALQRRDLARAATGLDRYLERRPKDVQAWFLAARTARRLGRMPDAERFLEQCQKLGGVTDATRLEWDLIRVQQGDLRDIDLRLRATIGPDHPDSLIVLEALAKGYYACERLSDAREACELWQRREPDHPWPWLWRGRIFERVQYFDRAEEDYRRALKNAPDDPEVRLALGTMLSHEKRPGEAAEHFDRVLQSLPNDHEALLGLAACRIEQGLADRAIPLIERVLADEPNSPSAFFLWGKAAWQQGDSAGAERWLRQAVEAAPDDADRLYLLIQCLRDRGQEAEADRLTQHLEELRRDLVRLGELIRIVAATPNAVAPRQEAGVIALRIGRPNDGLRWLNGALRAKGDHRSTHAALADYYGRNGDAALAETHRRLANSP